MEMETRMLAKNCRFADGWERIALTQDEIEAIDAAIRKKNIEVLRESIVDASEIFPLAVLPDDARWQFAIALFEARRPHIHTVLKEALDTKIANLRDGYGNGEV